MLLAALSSSVLAVGADSEPDAQSERSIPVPLKGIDISGKLHRVAEPTNIRGAVFVFLGIQCPISNGYVPQLKKLAMQCRQSKMEFYGVIADPSVTRAQAIRHQEEFRVTFPVLFDASGELRRALAATHTPHAILISREGERLYSGRIDNRYSAVGRRREEASVHDLQDAVNAFAAGRAIEVAVTEPVGCLLEDPPTASEGGTVNFNRHIAPILYANCSECHRSGESAPFPLLSYADAVAHGQQIGAVTQSRFMPPWHPIPGFGRFRHERRLQDSEIELIRRWLADGKPEGDPEDLLPPPEFRSGWKLGTPDLVLSMKDAFQLDAEGPDIHQHFVLPTGLRENRLVSAVEFRPGNPRVVHHASFYIDTTGAARTLQSKFPDVGYGSFPGPGFRNTGTLRSWLPGMSPEHLPSGSGQLLPARSDLVIEVHYRRSGRVETDRSTVGIYFAPANARQLVGEIQVFDKALTIPAGEPRHCHKASFVLPVSATLLDTAPHMHSLGREMKAVAVRPDGTVEPLIWIRDWDANWQAQYMYMDPIRLPAGTRIEVEAWFDNSAENPLNPHSPPQTIHWGNTTTAEMAICHFRYTCDSLDDMRTMHEHYLRYETEHQAGAGSGARSP